MSENTKLWDILGRTDPKHTKGFTRGGGFKGTAIKPIWSFRRMTEEFGPCGVGWGMTEPSFQVVPGTEGEVAVYCTVGVWHSERTNVIYGVGGDKVVAKNRHGLSTDDEAFKKSFTDAVTNALKLIGVGADVHMGLFEDSKYVDEMRDEFADEPTSKPKSSAELKRENTFPELDREIDECKTLIQLDKLAAAWRAKAATDRWNAAFKLAAKDRLDRRREELSQAPDADEFPGDLPSSVANARREFSQHPANGG